MALDSVLYSRLGGLVIILMPPQHQSDEIFHTVMPHHARLKGVPELRAESDLRAEMANGSRILALPGTERTIRGYAAADQGAGDRMPVHHEGIS